MARENTNDVLDRNLTRKIIDDQTCRCHQIPFIGAHRIHEPVILREPHIITSHK